MQNTAKNDFCKYLHTMGFIYTYDLMNIFCGNSWLSSSKNLEIFTKVVKVNVMICAHSVALNLKDQ